MNRDPTFWLIMSLTAIIVLCGLLIGCNAEAMPVETVVALDMLQRWPSDGNVCVPPAEPLVAPRMVAAALLAIVMFCAALESVRRK